MSQRPSHRIRVLLAAISVIIALFTFSESQSPGRASRAFFDLTGFRPTYKKPLRPLTEVKPLTGSFLRQDSDKALETAVATYVPSSGARLEIALVGALHVAEKDYYEKLNMLFGEYDAVLYELVAPTGARPDSSRKPADDPFSALQQALPELLGMNYQLSEINYRAKNFHHADLSIDELLEEGRRRGETPWSFGAGVMLDLLRTFEKIQEENKTTSPPQLGTLLRLMLDPLFVKRTLAEQLLKAEGQDGFGILPSLTPYLVEARNRRALEVLDREIASGKTKIAIFYGVAHLPDFERRLLQEYALERKSIRWIPAWDLTTSGDAKPPLALLLKLLRH